MLDRPTSTPYGNSRSTMPRSLRSARPASTSTTTMLHDPCRSRSSKGTWPWAPPKQSRTAALLRIMGWFDPRDVAALQVAKGTLGISHTGHIDAPWLILAAERLSEGLTEILVHPGFAEDLDPGQTRLLASRRTELDALCDPAVKEAFGRRNVELVHYGQLGS